ncbi:MAG: archease [Desulfobacteraceae bacterium]|nr:MAG: archease [Desulfobacteraceae bacterium]
MPYTLIDHTADIGICVTGETLTDLFAEAGRAMFDQITDAAKLSASHSREIEITGIDRPDLLVNFLRELLCFWTIDACLVKNVRIRYINDARLTADIHFDEFVPETHEILKDIKAVTYHGISVNETDAGWEAMIIFDV